jgi:putative transposase
VIDTFGAILDFMLSTNRDEEAATRCCKQSIANNVKSEKVVIYKSGANNAGLMNLHTLLFFFGATCFINLLRVKYLNNIIEQVHRFIKKVTEPMMNFKAFHSASAALAGIELAHIIRKTLFKKTGLSDYHQFLELVA